MVLLFEPLRFHGDKVADMAIGAAPAFERTDRQRRWRVPSAVNASAAAQRDRSSLQAGPKGPCDRASASGSTVSSNFVHAMPWQCPCLPGRAPLAIVAAYSLEQFQHLLRTAGSVDGRPLPPMSWVRNVDFTDEEIDDPFAFLRTHNGVAQVLGKVTPNHALLFSVKPHQSKKRSQCCIVVPPRSVRIYPSRKQSGSALSASIANLLGRQTTDDI